MGIDTSLIMEVKNDGIWTCANHNEKGYKGEFYPFPIHLKREVLKRRDERFSKYEYTWDDIPKDLSKEGKECLNTHGQVPIYIVEFEIFRLIWWYS